jgi:hypothetical protein
MTNETAQRIGSKEALKCVTIGLVIAELIMAVLTSDRGFLKGLFWFTSVEYKLNLFIALIIFYSCGFVYGRMAGKAIIIRGWNYLLTGLLYGFLIVITTAFLSGWTGYFREGIDLIGSNEDLFADYIMKPVFLVTFFGLVPTTLTGLWFGYSIWKNRKGMQKYVAY